MSYRIFVALKCGKKMSAIYILIGASLPIAIGFLVAFLISAKRGQFDDDYTPSIRMLTDDTETEINQTEIKPNEKIV